MLLLVILGYITIALFEAILLVAIVGYSIGGYYCLYILLVAIVSYFIGNY
jgi:hypothetical protein